MSLLFDCDNIPNRDCSWSSTDCLCTNKDTKLWENAKHDLAVQTENFSLIDNKFVNFTMETCQIFELVGPIT